MRTLVALALVLTLTGAAHGQTCFAGASGDIHCISTGVHIGPQNYFALYDQGPDVPNRQLSVSAARGFFDLSGGARDVFSDGIRFFFDGKTISRPNNPDLGYGLDLYFVEGGQPFTKAAIDNGHVQPIYLGTRQPYVEHTPVDIPESGSFYLGVNSGFVSLDANGDTIRDTFGWALIERGLSGQLFLTNYAMAYQSQGIIVGTTQTVPEPESAIIVFTVVATVVLWGLTKRRQ
jgi:hypothetical protein